MIQMINAETNNHGVDNGGVAFPGYKLGNAGAGIPPTQDKQQSAATKKTALKDVQNQNGSLARNHQDNFSFIGGGLSTDAVKVCGNKRLTPERPSNLSFYPALSNNCANEQIMNARRRFELELGRGSIHSKVSKIFEGHQTRQLHQMQLESPQKQTHLRPKNSYCEPVATANNVVAPVINSFSGPPAPNVLGKYGPRLQAAHTDSVKITLECPDYVPSKNTDEEQRTQRFIRLQKFLKECDEVNCRGYAQRLRLLSPAELSRHAFELETKAIQLTVEEKNEIERMQALNVLGTSVMANKPHQRTQGLQPRK